MHNKILQIKNILGFHKKTLEIVKNKSDDDFIK